MTSENPHPVVEVDARGLRCPVPVIRLAAALAENPPGTLVRLLATDPAAHTDVPAFCRMRGAQLLEVTGIGDHTAYLVRRVSSTVPAEGPATTPGAARDTPDD
ncbi:MAG: sulfurtransferase TusA family protein [Dermatophilaceae bacterium]